jgi:hypothetical protein
MMKSIYKLGGICIVFFALGIASCQKIPSEEVHLIVAADHKAQFLNPWLDLHLEMIKLTSGYSPPVASRTIGYTYLALYESVQHGMPGYQSLNERYAIDSNYPQPDLGQHYHWPAAATASMAYMLRHLFPLASSSFKTQIDVLEQADSLRYASTVDINVLERSLQFGRSLAAVIYQWSTSDGAYFAFTRNYPSNYVAPTGAGLWVPTPSVAQLAFNYKPAMQPFWGNNRPFEFINVGTSLLLPPPMQYDTNTNSAYYLASMAVYQQGNNNTPEQIEIAEFWADDVGSYSPPGHSIAITQIVMNDQLLSLDQAAEILARIGIGVSDAFVNCFKNKYLFNYLRPITFIQAYIDVNWNSLIGSPPFPEYASCHSTQSATTAHILAHYFGDDLGFVDNSKTAQGYQERSFNSFYEFAQEAANSRYYGGVHYAFSCTEGYDTGVLIGTNVLAIPFKK